MDLKNTIERIQLLAAHKGWSINHLVVSVCGMTKSVVDDMKRGRMPSAEKITIIAKALDTSSSFLVGETTDPNPPNIVEPLYPAEGITYLRLNKFATEHGLQEEDLLMLAEALARSKDRERIAQDKKARSNE